MINFARAKGGAGKEKLPKKVVCPKITCLGVREILLRLSR